ncbi:MAG TPA: ABC transporter substrate-binding protein [Burkholderiales bacterium]|nr:ABC transporter substrate-binding protein [Burkholderiales bacterium]
MSGRAYKRLLVASAIALVSGWAAAQQPTKLVFYTNWYAEAEHGGFYQAVAEGTYARHGLDVEVKMGGPQINVMQLLLAGQADLIMGYDLQTIKAIEQGLPVITVAATFQKDPAVLIAHPGVATLAELKSRTLLIGQASETTFWPWLKAKYGFTDAQKRPYAFSVQQFLVDQNVAQQGYLTSEPYTIEKAGIKPTVFLLADSGYPPYAETIVVTTQTLQDKPDIILRFVQASAEGWRSYLKNPAPGNALINKANPEMSSELLAYGVAKMKAYGLVTGGDARTLGILAMTDVRWKQTFDFMVSAGLTRPAVDYRKAYTLQFVKEIKVLP